MSETFEDILDGLGISWREFCQNPYEAIALIEPPRVLYSTTKVGYFVFDRHIIERCLFEGELFTKRISIDSPNHPQIRDFFSKWLFFREDQDALHIKKHTFRMINKSSRHSVPVSAIEWRTLPLDELYRSLRKSLFSYIMQIFFVCDDIDLDTLYEKSENIFGYIQSDLNFDESRVVDAIVAFTDLYYKNKKYDFERDDFDGAILNCIIDGYEPLNDLVWNTVDILFSRQKLLNEFVAYQIALHSTPSFRYVVRHVTKEMDESDFRLTPGEKLFCFLSPRMHLGTSANVRSIVFGAGRHICVGRQMAESLVPSLALSIMEFLRERGVTGVELRRSASLGAEGVHHVDFNAR